MTSPWQRRDVTKIVVYLIAFIPVKRNWLKIFWISGRRRFLFLQEQKKLVWRTTSTSLKTLLWFWWLKRTITVHGGLLQSFSCYAFKSSKFAYIALSYMCMLSKICKKKKKLHDFMILFASVCTATRQKQMMWHYDPTASKNCIPFLSHILFSYNIHSAWAMALLSESSLKSHLVLIFHSFQFLR